MKHHRPESLIHRGIRTQDQVARMLGVTRGTVYIYETSALRKMREALADLAPAPAPGTAPGISRSGGTGVPPVMEQAP